MRGEKGQGERREFWERKRHCEEKEREVGWKVDLLTWV